MRPKRKKKKRAWLKFGKKLGKILKIGKNTLKSYFRKIKKKQKKLGEIEKVRKNNESQEKYFGKLGKILKIRKNTLKSQEKY